MQFEYLYKIEATGQIDIDNIGECCLSACNDGGKEYILIIHTENGLVKVLEYGPILIDIESPANFVSCIYKEFQWNQKWIIGIIEKFLDNPKSMITQVTQIDLEDAKNKIKNLVDFL